MTQPPEGWSVPGSTPPTPPPPPGYGPPPPGWSQPAPAWGEPAAGWGPPQQGWGPPQPQAPKPGVVPLRPLALGELLDGAVSVIRRYPRPTLGLSFLIAALSTVLTVLSVLALDTSTLFQPDLTTDELGTGDTGFDIGSTASLLSTAVGFFAGLVLTGAMVAVVGKGVLGREAPPREVWDAVRPRLWALLGLALLTALIAFGATGVLVAVGVLLGVTLGAPGIALGVLVGIAGVAAGVYLYVRLSLAAPALVLEKVGVRTAMTRSGVLVARSWWRVFGILLLTQVIGSIVSGIITLPVSAAVGIGTVVSGTGDPGALALVGIVVASGFAQALVAPFTSGVRALLYVDRRMRAEGLDVTLQTAAATPS